VIIIFSYSSIRRNGIHTPGEVDDIIACPVDTSGSITSVTVVMGSGAVVVEYAGNR